ncbi:LysE family transporter [Amycolatopsis sp. NPDC102389]|uniref:LysE family transporter n=1 Tax=Amycolatopsis sp. NPDC102389 TaxID=3363941 RepID=UPI003813B937
MSAQGIALLATVPCPTIGGCRTRRPPLLCVAVWIAVDIVWYSSLALLVTRLGEWLRCDRVKLWLERTSGGVLVGFGVTVALEG